MPSAILCCKTGWACEYEESSRSIRRIRRFSVTSECLASGPRRALDPEHPLTSLTWRVLCVSGDKQVEVATACVAAADSGGDGVPAPPAASAASAAQLLSRLAMYLPVPALRQRTFRAVQVRSPSFA